MFRIQISEPMTVTVQISVELKFEHHGNFWQLAVPGLPPGPCTCVLWLPHHSSLITHHSSLIVHRPSSAVSRRRSQRWLPHDSGPQSPPTSDHGARSTGHRRSGLCLDSGRLESGVWTLGSGKWHLASGTLEFWTWMQDDGTSELWKICPSEF